MGLWQDRYTSWEGQQRSNALISCIHLSNFTVTQAPTVSRSRLPLRWGVMSSCTVPRWQEKSSQASLTKQQCLSVMCQGKQPGTPLVSLIQAELFLKPSYVFSSACLDRRGQLAHVSTNTRTLRTVPGSGCGLFLLVCDYKAETLKCPRISLQYFWHVQAQKVSYILWKTPDRGFTAWFSDQISGETARQQRTGSDAHSSGPQAVVALWELPRMTCMGAEDLSRPGLTSELWAGSGVSVASTELPWIKVSLVLSADYFMLSSATLAYHSCEEVVHPARWEHLLSPISHCRGLCVSSVRNALQEKQTCWW